MQSQFRITDQALARSVGISQSNVSRALNRRPAAWTPSLHKLYIYAINISQRGGPVDFETYGKETLARAGMEAWDGTQEGLDRLVRLLGIAKEIGKAGEQVTAQAGRHPSRK